MIIVSAKEMQQMDRMTIESFGIPGRVLMENAGTGAVRFMFEKFHGLPHSRVGIVAGRGNNGGDGFVMARYLSQKQIPVTVYLLTAGDKVQGDAKANLDLLPPLKIPVVEMPNETVFRKYKASMRRQDIWVDAILGTGLNTDVKGYYRSVIDFINRINKPIFSVDIPSGIHSNTGRICGTAIRAQATATFAFAKAGHLIYPGARHTGDLDVVDIGIPRFIVDAVNPRLRLLTIPDIKSLVVKRRPDVHKGKCGHLLVISGSPGKTGAAAMTAMAAMRCGAGLVTLGVPKSLNPVLECQILEAMTYALPETQDGMLDIAGLHAVNKLLTDKKCLAVGPGIGTAFETEQLLSGILAAIKVPVVIDADGLNLLAHQPDRLKKLTAPVVLTPHPGEMARLCNTSVQKVQEDRIECARHFSEFYGVHVVLKGARTVMAHPDGAVAINSTGNSGMASGGMGDVLTGLIAGFISQGYSVKHAIHLAVFVHGAAADALSFQKGPFGFLASEVMNGIPAQIKALFDE
jgi:NAD(P)H-hydrate epimerase